MNEAEKIFAGILVAFGIPLVFFVYFNWKAALASFIAGQLAILISKSL